MEYFPDNYAWSLTAGMLFDEVGTFHEVMGDADQAPLNRRGVLWQTDWKS